MDRATLETLDRETLVELVLHLVAEQATVIAALQEQVAALQRENAELRARLGQNSSNSSRPPSSDLPGAAPRGETDAQRPGERVGSRGTRAINACCCPLEQVDQVIALVPAVCRQCGEVLPATASPGDPADERQQVTELPPPRAEVTEYHLAARRCRKLRDRDAGQPPSRGWSGELRPPAASAGGVAERALSAQSPRSGPADGRCLGRAGGVGQRERAGAGHQHGLGAGGGRSSRRWRNAPRPRIWMRPAGGKAGARRTCGSW